MNYSKLTTSAVLIGSLALSACGSSDPAGTRAGAAPKSFNFGDNTATYNAATGIVTLDGATASQNGDPVNKSNGQAFVARSADGVFFTSIAGDGMTYAMSSVSVSGAKRSGQVFGTEGTSNAPQAVTDTITGDVTIGADFSSNTFQGNINNRVSFATSGSQRGVGDTVGFSGRISSDLSFQGAQSIYRQQWSDPGRDRRRSGPVRGRCLRNGPHIRGHLHRKRCLRRKLKLERFDWC